jgi:hypothetical protein
MLAAENSGLEFNPEVGPRRGEVIELPDDDNDNVIDDDINKGMITRVKEEEQEQQTVTENDNEDAEMEGTSEQSTRSEREQSTPRRYEDYELYVAVEEEDESMLATSKDESTKEEDNNNELEAVEHHIKMPMMSKKRERRERRSISPKLGNLDSMRDSANLGTEENQL